MESIKPTLLAICIILCSSFIAQGQINLIKYEGLTNGQNEILGSKFSNYSILQVSYDFNQLKELQNNKACLLYTSPSPRD